MVIIGTYGEYGDEADDKSKTNLPEVEPIDYENVEMVSPAEIKKIQEEELKKRRERLEQQLKDIQDGGKKIRGYEMHSPSDKATLNDIDREIGDLNADNNNKVYTFKEFDKLLAKRRNKGLVYGILIGLVIGICGTLIYVFYA